MLEFGVLGPLDVRTDGRTVALGGARPRAVLAVLVLHANQPVSAERLAVALWGEDAPPSAVKTVQVYVARLRKALEDPDALVTTPAGYCLRVRSGELATPLPVAAQRPPPHRRHGSMCDHDVSRPLVADPL